jgi:16S rRNA G1207 methylase RsmC
MPETCFELLGRSFDIQRYPPNDASQLRAWDSADRYLLDQVEQSLADFSKVIVLHDNFGTLTLVISEIYEVSLMSYGDSWMSREAICSNIQANTGQGFDGFVSTLTLDGLTEFHQDKPVLVVGRVPKAKAELASLLNMLRQGLPENSCLLLAGMDKYLSKGQFDLIAKYFGEAEFLPGWKKARVWRATIDKTLEVKRHKPLATFTVPDFELTIQSYPNVFSRDSLDIGARFFLEHYSYVPSKLNVVDLACGSGVLGLAYLKRHAASHMLFTDESYQALASTQLNIDANFDQGQCVTEVRADDALKSARPGSIDLVLCNPPFHQQTTISIDIAYAMFENAKRALCKGGQLWLVANRHLGYHQVLKRLFGNSTTVEGNRKFVILRAVKR